MATSKILGNYFKIALRNLNRNKFYSTINILGLAVGISCSVLIMLFINDEFAYDTFHSKKDRIYRVCEILDGEEGQGEKSSSQPFPVGNALINDHPDLVQSYVRFFNFQESTHTLQYKDIKINEKKTFFADSTLFDVFDFPLEKGNPAKALNGINSIVISKKIAKKYFGDEDPMGKLLKFDGKVELMVTGVFKEIPTQSHIHFDCLISFQTLKQLLGPNIGSKNWVWNPCWTYILLKENVTQTELEKQFSNFIKKHFPDFIIPQATLYLQKLTDIHLNSDLAYELEPNSNKNDIYIFGAIGIFILVIACINFMNLSTARSSKRAKEVGMRKAIGAYRSQLIFQFLGESFLFSFIALIISFVLILALLPAFNSFSGKQLSFGTILELKTFSILFSITFLVGLVAGIYPAFFLSSFKPTEVLKSSFNQGAKSKLLRQSFVVIQFAISIALIISTIIIYRQLNYLQNAELGFKKDQVLIVPVRAPMAKVYLPFSEELKNSPDIVNVATMNDILGVSHNTHEYNYEGMAPNKQWIYFPSLIVSPTFVETMGIKIVAGRSFNKDIKSDDSLAVIINEAMVKHLGWGTAQNAIGKQFFTPSGKERVIGVAADYNFVSLKQNVGPFVLDISDPSNKLLWTKYIIIRIPAANEKKTIEFIEKKWNTFTKEYPFEYFFLNENLEKSYQSQENLAKLVGYFSILAIFIACLGLFALASFTVEQRTKEMGIRKVLGASALVIVNLVSKEFIKLVIIANLIAWPLTWWLMQKWLNDFAYRISIGFWVFLISGCIALAIAQLTVLFHALRSAKRNPVTSLKYE
ncbi:MAG: ABC transporter permease [Bacteroidia bacterium]|nr:ABC transporter permease [Bacteroidia bacterium]